jgi:hypothetical protein
LPELAAESVATAERLVGLSAQANLGAAEADYVLASGLAALRRVPRLWPIVRARIGAGVTASTAREEVARLLVVADKNLALARTLKEPVRALREELGREPEGEADLSAAEEQIRAVRAEVVRLLKVLEAPAAWPPEEQLRAAKEQMRLGDRLSAEAFRQALLGE